MNAESALFTLSCYGYFFDLTGLHDLCAHFKSVSSAFSEVDMTVKLAAL